MSYNQIYQWAQSQPTKTAFISNDVAYSYAAFANAVEAVRRDLDNHRLPVGRRAIVLSTNPGHAWIIVYALRALGLTTVVVQSLAQAVALRLTDVTAIVAPQYNEAAFDSRQHPYDDAKRILIPDIKLANDLSGNLELHRDTTVPLGGHILFTSGTTGSYKKLLVRGEQEDKRNFARASAYPITNRTVYNAANFGLWTTIGFRIAPAVWHMGGTVILENRDTFARFFRYPVNFGILTPSMFAELIAKIGIQPRRDDCELMVTAGFLPSAVVKDAMRLITNKLSNSYGSTELSTPALLSHTPASLDWLRPSLNRIIRIIDEDGSECAADNQGELQVQLKDIDCDEYLDDTEASGKIFRDGFFCPGDMAVRRADGRIRILGRTADVLNIQGTKIAVAPIELKLRHVLDVEEVCLFSGITHQGISELIVAVQTNKQLAKAELEAAARQFPGFENIRFSFFKEFPRTEAGTQKVKRALLRKMIDLRSST